MQELKHGLKKSSAIEKALDVLMAFTPHNQPIGTLEVSKRLEMHKATASRILLTLTKRGFLQQDLDTKKFRLGRLALNMGRAVVDSLNGPIVRVAKAHIEELRKALNTTIVLEQLVGKRTVIMYVAHGAQRIRLASDVGNAVPVYAAAGAKAILAFSDSAVVESIMEGRSVFPAMTAKTITDPSELTQDLRETRLRGFSIDNEEIDIGVKAIGVPLFNCENLPVAALVAVFPAHRLSRKIDPHIVSQLKKAAEAISVEL